MELAGKTIKKNDSLLSFGNSKNQVDDIIPFEIQKSVVINTNPENDDDSQRSTL